MTFKLMFHKNMAESTLVLNASYILFLIDKDSSIHSNDKGKLKYFYRKILPMHTELVYEDNMTHSQIMSVYWFTAKIYIFLFFKPNVYLFHPEFLI